MWPLRPRSSELCGRFAPGPVNYVAVSPQVQWIRWLFRPRSSKLLWPFRLRYRAAQGGIVLSATKHSNSPISAGDDIDVALLAAAPPCGPKKWTIKEKRNFDKESSLKRMRMSNTAIRTLTRKWIMCCPFELCLSYKLVVCKSTLSRAVRSGVLPSTNERHAHFSQQSQYAVGLVRFNLKQNEIDKSKNKIFITLAVLHRSMQQWRDPSPRLSSWTTQLRRNVAAVAGRWQNCVWFESQRIEPRPPASIAIATTPNRVDFGSSWRY